MFRDLNNRPHAMMFDSNTLAVASNFDCQTFSFNSSNVFGLKTTSRPPLKTIQSLESGRCQWRLGLELNSGIGLERELVERC